MTNVNEPKHEGVVAVHNTDDKTDFRCIMLNENNYVTWKWQMKIVLVSKDLWNCISGSGSPNKINQATAILASSLSILNQQRVVNCTTAQEIWNTLEATYENKSSSEKTALLDKMTSYRIRSIKEVSKGIGELQAIVAKLRTMDSPVSEDLLISLLLKALPPALNSWRSTWKMVNAKSPSLNALITGIMAEINDMKDPSDRAFIATNKSQPKIQSKGLKPYKRFNKPKDNQNNNHSDINKGNCSQGSFNNRSSRPTDVRAFCNHCKKTGHWANNCWAKNDTKKNKSNSIRDVAMMATDVDLNSLEIDESTWIADSGATLHMTPNLKWLINYKKLEEDKPIHLGDGHEIPAKGIGYISTEFGRLENVHYVPELSANLFSITAAANHGIETRCSKHKIELVKNGQQILAGKKQYGIYTLEFFCRGGRDTAYAAVPLSEWHKRFGHASDHVISTMMKMNAVDGLEIDDDCKHDQCTDCVLGKCTRASHPEKTTPKAILPGQSLHIDTVGKSRIESLGGALYYVLCKDEMSSYRIVKFVATKSSIPDEIKQMVSETELKTGNKVLRINSDNGSEFLNQSLMNFLKERGITYHTSVVYTPEQNGFIERDVRTITESARTMLIEAKLDPKLWAEAVNTAVYVRNRTINKSDTTKTPYEKWCGIKPNVKNLRRFGQRAIVAYKDDERTKWDSKGVEQRFVGYTDVYNTYRFYDKLTDKVYISCHCVFLKDNDQDLQDSSDEDYDTILLPDFERSGTEEVSDHMNTDLIWDYTDLSSRLNNAEKELHKTSADEENFPQSEHQIPSESLVQQEHSNIPSHKKMNRDSLIPVGESSAKFLSKSSTSQQEEKPSMKPVQKKHTKADHMKDVSARPRNTDIHPSHIISERLRKPKPGQIYRANIARMQEEEDPQNFKEAMQRSDSEKWMKAIQEELDSLKKNNVFELVDRPEGNIVTNKWVLKVKRRPNGAIDRYKARLVARGFSQIHGIDYTDTYAPVANMVSIRMIFAYAAAENLHMSQFDVKTAFLYGELDETVYMEQPEGFEEDKSKVCLLKKSLYGLKQAPRQWNKKFSAALKLMNLHESEHDHCIFFNHDPLIIVAIYVDDGIILARDMNDVNRLLSLLEQEFDISRVDSNVYLGFEYIQEKDFINIHQASYITKILKRFAMDKSKPVDNPCPVDYETDDEKGIDQSVPYREAVGSLMYAAVISRPDISYAVGRVSRKVSNPTMTDWKNVKRIFRYLKDKERYGITYQQNYKYTLSAYCDSDFAGDKTTQRSTTGSVILLGDSPIYWKSQRQSLVTLSTTEAEAVSLCTTVKDVVWIRRLAIELGIVRDIPTEVFCDNTSAIKITTDEKSVHRTRHMAVQTAYPRELCAKGEIKIKHVKTDHQLADFLTKSLTKDKFSKNCSKLMYPHGKIDNKPKKSVKFKGLFGAVSLLLILITGISCESDQLKMNYEIDYVYSNPCSKLADFRRELLIGKDWLGRCAENACHKVYQDSWIHEIERLLKISNQSVCGELSHKNYTGITISNIVTEKHYIMSKEFLNITDEDWLGEINSKNNSHSESIADDLFKSHEREFSMQQTDDYHNSYAISNYYDLVGHMIISIINSLNDIRMINSGITNPSHYGPNLLQFLNLMFTNNTEVLSINICESKRVSIKRLRLIFEITFVKRDSAKSTGTAGHSKSHCPDCFYEPLIGIIIMINGMILAAIVIQVIDRRQKLPNQACIPNVRRHSPFSYSTASLILCLMNVGANRLPEHHNFEHVQPALYMPTDTILETGLRFYNVTYSFLNPCFDIYKFTNPNDTLFESYKALEYECNHLFINEWVPKIKELAEIHPVHENNETDESIERRRRSIEAFAAGLGLAKDLYFIVSNVIHTVYDFFDQKIFTNKFKNLQEYTQRATDNFQKKFDVVHEVSGGILNELHNLNRSVIEQRRQLEFMKRSLTRYTWTSNYIQNKILSSIADLRTIANAFSKGRIPPVEIATLFNITQLNMIDEQDTYFESCKQLKTNTLEFIFAVREHSHDTHIYEMITFDYWTNLLTRPTLFSYRGPRFIIYNRTNRCIKQIDQPSKRNIRGACRLKGSTANLKRWVEIDSGDPFLKKHKPQIYTTRKYNFIYCFPGSVHIDYIERRCPPSPFRISTKRQVDTGDFFWLPERHNITVTQMRIVEENIHPDHFEYDIENEEEVIESYLDLKEQLTQLKGELNSALVIDNTSYYTIVYMTILILLSIVIAIVIYYYLANKSISSEETNNLPSSPESVELMTNTIPHHNSVASQIYDTTSVLTRD